MKMIDVYVEQHREQLLEAGQRAYAQLGRGAIVARPQLDAGNGRTPGNYHLLEWFLEDQDPAAGLVERYDPASEAVLILMMDRPQGIYTYRLTETGCYLELEAVR